MKVVMILPPTAASALLGPSLAFGVMDVVTKGVAGTMPTPASIGNMLTFSLFIDMQSSVTGLHMRRYLVEHPVPGREGGPLQDLGSPASRMTLEGKWIYENEPDDMLLKTLSNIFGGRIGWNWLRLQTMQVVSRLKLPVYVASDLITSAFLIDDMKFKQIGGEPNVYNYTITLVEWMPMLTILGSLGSVGISAISSENLGS